MQISKHSIVLIFISAFALTGCGNGSDNTDNGSDSATNVQTNSSVSVSTSSNKVMLDEMFAQTGLTREFAVAQFVAHFGPLVNAPQYTYDTSMSPFATHAVSELMQFKDELEPALLAEVYQNILPKPAPKNASSTTNYRSNNLLPLQALSFQSQLDMDDAIELLSEVRRDLELRMGRTLVNDIELIRVSSREELIPGDQNKSLMFALSLESRNTLLESGHVEIGDYGLKSADNCWLVLDEGDEAMSQISSSKDLLRLVLAHEVTHCFQFELGAATAPSWVIEGMAHWVGEAYIDGLSISEDPWLSYEQSTYNLFKTADPYSAIGFYSHVSEALSDGLWTSLPTLMESSSRESADNLTLAIQLMGEDAYNAWPSKDMNRIEWGETWRIIGAGNRIPTRATMALHEERASAKFGEVKALHIAPDRTDATPTILNVQTDGVGRMHWENGGNTMEFGENFLFCVTGDCVCQNGELPSGVNNVIDATSLGNLVIAMTGKSDKSASKLKHNYIQVVSVCPMTPEPTPTPTPEPTTAPAPTPNPKPQTGPTPIPVPNPGPVVTPVPEPTVDNTDACLIGDWYLDKTYMEEQIWPNLPGAMVGELHVELYADGTGVNNIDLQLIEPVVDGVLFNIRFTGNTHFNWASTSTKDGNFLTGTQSENNVETHIFVDGLEIPPSSAQPSNSPDNFALDGSMNRSRYVCSTESLVITQSGANANPVRYVR